MVPAHHDLLAVLLHLHGGPSVHHPLTHLTLDDPNGAQLLVGNQHLFAPVVEGLHTLATVSITQAAPRGGGRSLPVPPKGRELLQTERLLGALGGFGDILIIPTLDRAEVQLRRVDPTPQRQEGVAIFSTLYRTARVQRANRFLGNVALNLPPDEILVRLVGKHRNDAPQVKGVLWPPAL